MDATDSAALRPLAEWPQAARAGLRALFTDIDDTLTWHGRLPAAAFAALEALDAAGVAVVCVTGRPAGWCDHIARFWPVAGVVGENGALAFHYDRAARRLVRRFMDPDEVRRDARARLAALGERVLVAVPGCALASDQQYRESDLAIDFCEDVPPLPQADVARIVTMFEAAGATAKVSSIHVNGWFGQYDKMTMARRYTAEVLGFDLEEAIGRCAYVGDSPNDAPMFAAFPHAIGVANVRRFLGRMAAMPRYVTASEGGYGFVEVAEAILAAHRHA
jgi:HAD superfamily hydrolase (TIGR01484 family)